MDYSGCGNTVNANHPIVQKFILDCLHYWVEEMHVDGFRFDEGSVLHRGGDGAPMEFPPVVWGIELSEKLADTKVIAEAVGRRRPLRRRPVPGLALVGLERPLPRRRAALRARRPRARSATIATRISGSMDMYEGGGRSPANSVNFITAHDGFTLYDLVAYNEKHNEANGEGNRDGDRRQPELELRRRGRDRRPGDQRAPRAAAQELRGDPVRLAGRADVRRRRRGRPHAARQQQRLLPGQRALAGSTGRCVEENAELFRFFKQMIALRRRHASLRRRSFLTGGRHRRGLQDIRWHGLELDQAEWDEPRVARARLHARRARTPLEPDLHVMMNMDDAPHDFAVPAERRPPLARVRRHREGRRPTTSRSPARSSRSRASAARSRAAAS